MSEKRTRNRVLKKFQNMSGANIAHIHYNPHYRDLQSPPISLSFWRALFPIEDSELDACGKLGAPGLLQARAVLCEADVLIESQSPCHCPFSFPFDSWVGPWDN